MLYFLLYSKVAQFYTHTHTYTILFHIILHYDLLQDIQFIPTSPPNPHWQPEV